MVAASCRRPILSGPASDDRLSRWLQHPAGDPYCQDPPARGHHTGFISRGSLPPMGVAGERPEFYINPSLLTQLLKSFLQWNTSARQLRFEISFLSLRRAAKGYWASPARLPVILLASRSKQLVFAYDPAYRPSRSYRPSGVHHVVVVDPTPPTCCQQSPAPEIMWQPAVSPPR